MTRFANAAAILALTAVPTAIVTLQPQATAHADSCADAVANHSLPLDAGACADVLAQETRWLKAITDGGRATVESILSPNYRHITSDGVLLNRDAEIASTTPLLLRMTPSEQIVDIAGDTAVVHGVNTLTDATGVLERARFTDVFVLQDGTWMALSAQESALD